MISGYVITSSLLGRASKDFKDFISGFYERRVKRLVPALSVFVLITSIAICLFNPSPGVSLWNGITSLFGLSNLYLLKQSTDYFAQSTELNVFTHTWSLGVEEQFYILFPFLIWFSGFGRQTKNGARNLFLAVGALTIASLIGFFYLYPTNQPPAYFLMPSRFWEMAAGCLIFIGFQKSASIEQFLEKVPPLLVIALIVGVMYLPMSIAPASTIAVVVLSSVLIACLKKQTAAFKVFTHPKVVYIGLISYSLYLWHWGVLSISRWTIGIHWWSAPFQVALMLGLAIASCRWIETPFRKGNWFGKRWKTLVVGGGVLAMVSGSLVALGKPLKGNLYLGDSSGTDYSKYDRLPTSKCPSAEKFKLERITNCTLKSSNGKNVLVVGDSQTGHLAPLLDMLNHMDGFGIFYYQSGGTAFPSLIEIRNTNKKSPIDFRRQYQKSLDYFDYYFSLLKKGDAIILCSRYELRWGERPIPNQQKDLKFTFYDSYYNKLTSEESFVQWTQLFDDFAKKSAAKGVKLIVFNSIPSFQNFIPHARSEWFNYLGRRQLVMSRKHLIDHSRLVDEAFNFLADSHQNVEVYDIFSELCPGWQRLCTPDRYRDQWHLSISGSLSLRKSLLKKIN